MDQGYYFYIEPTILTAETAPAATTRAQELANLTMAVLTYIDADRAG